MYMVNRGAYTSSYLAAGKIVEQGQLDLAVHIKNLSMGFFGSRDPGDLSTLMIHDFEELNTMISRMLPQFVSSAVFPIISVAVLCFIEWRLSLAIGAVVLSSLPLVFVSRFISGRDFFRINLAPGPFLPLRYLWLNFLVLRIFILPAKAKYTPAPLDSEEAEKCLRNFTQRHATMFLSVSLGISATSISSPRSSSQP
jgi:ABC-type multidrug transport system fused ATPase/permease subunit